MASDPSLVVSSTTALLSRVGVDPPCCECMGGLISVWFGVSRPLALSCAGDCAVGVCACSRHGTESAVPRAASRCAGGCSGGGRGVWGATVTEAAVGSSATGVSASHVMAVLAVNPASARVLCPRGSLLYDRLVGHVCFSHQNPSIIIPPVSVCHAFNGGKIQNSWGGWSW